MSGLLTPLGVELIRLNDLKTGIPQVAETGETPLDNARLKAQAYYKAFGIPVFSCDSGLYFDHIPEALQPGIHVRLVNGKRLTDEEMITYYSGLAKTYGDLTARYQNAICLIKSPEEIWESMDDSLSGERFILTSKPHGKRREGFPLDSLSIHIKTGKYYFDMDGCAVDMTALDQGFRQFFLEHL